MSKNFRFFLGILIIICLCSLILCACGETHTHTYEDVAAVAPTCTTAGVIAHKHCTGCNKNFIDGIEKSADELIVPTEGHALSYVPAENPTCTKNGTLTHQHCSVCGKNFIDNVEKNRCRTCGRSNGTQPFRNTRGESYLHEERNIRAPTLLCLRQKLH